jgi:hypothetical protein
MNSFNSFLESLFPARGYGMMNDGIALNWNFPNGSKLNWLTASDKEKMKLIIETARNSNDHSFRLDELFENFRPSSNSMGTGIFFIKPLTISLGNKNYTLSMIIGISTNIYGKYKNQRFLFPNDLNYVDTRYGSGYRLKDIENLTRIIIYGSYEDASDFMDWYYDN